MIFITNPKDHSCRIFILISDRSIDKADRQNKSNQVTVWTRSLRGQGHCVDLDNDRSKACCLARELY